PSAREDSVKCADPGPHGRAPALAADSAKYACAADKVALRGRSDRDRRPPTDGEATADRRGVPAAAGLSARQDARRQAPGPLWHVRGDRGRAADLPQSYARRGA